MDRTTVYYGALPRDVDILMSGRYAMTGLAKLAEALLGRATAVDGFTLAPTAPASLNAVLGAGQIYQVANLEANPWGSLSVDTHSILKQGVLLDPTNLTFAVPSTVGYAQNVLVEVQYQDVDDGNVLLPYYNASAPSQPFSGPGNNNQQQSTVRKGSAAIQLKYGTAATSGTQVTPAPDAGWAGLFVVTLAFGQTTITSGNIALYPGAPFIPYKLPDVPAQAAAAAGKAAIAAAVRNYSASTTWTKPANLNYIRVIMMGAGGGGGISSGGYTGGSGGNGAYIVMEIPASLLNSTESVVVGTAAPATTGTFNTGATGGSSTFKGVTAQGGVGGTGAAGANGVGGAGGQLGGTPPTTSFQGYFGVNGTNGINVAGVATIALPTLLPGFGTGGSGLQAAGSSSASTAGLVIIEEYLLS